MNSESLIKALTNIPVEIFNFDEVCFDDENHDNESIDSLGSCCNSPDQSSESSLSPNPNESPSEDNESYFIFPTRHLDLPARVKSSTTSTPKGDNPDKTKRKMECKVKRNERERRRVRRLADGFRKLREVVPGNYKKLSKLDTLKRALDYMSGLSDILDMHNSHYTQDIMYDNTVPYIKQENQYSPEYHNPCQVSTAYQTSTISYQPTPEWSMYPEKQEQMAYPTMSSNITPYYTPQRMMVQYN